MAFNDTKAFKKIEAEWYKKLSEDGFKDAEVEKKGQRYLRVWHSTYFYTKHAPSKFKLQEIYYNIASKMLHTYPFSNVFEQCIWLLHSEGESLRDIAETMGTTVYRAHTVIKKICLGMKDFDKQNELLENE